MICVTCKQDKPNEDFPWKNKNAGIRNPYCKLCKKAYNRTWYEKNKDKHMQTVMKNNQRYRAATEAIINELKSVPCTDCGISYHPFVMDFDHLEGFEKIADVSYMRARGKPLQIILDEIAKCEIVCANCHRMRTYNRMKAQVSPLSPNQSLTA